MPKPLNPKPLNPKLLNPKPKTLKGQPICLQVLVRFAGAVLMQETPTWRLTARYKSGYKSPNMGCNYSYPTCNPTYNYP